MDDAVDKDAVINELRAVLAPLLDGPIQMGERDDNRIWCVFCEAEQAMDGVHVGPFIHEDDCPVLRKDELLGR